MIDNYYNWRGMDRRLVPNAKKHGFYYVYSIEAYSILNKKLFEYSGVIIISDIIKGENDCYIVYFIGEDGIMHMTSMSSYTELGIKDEGEEPQIPPDIKGQKKEEED